MDGCSKGCAGPSRAVSLVVGELVPEKAFRLSSAFLPASAAISVSKEVTRAFSASTSALFFARKRAARQ